MSDNNRTISGTIKTQNDSGSPEAVANALCRAVAQTEKRRDEVPYRNYLLDLYAECLEAARGLRDFR